MRLSIHKAAAVLAAGTLVAALAACSGSSGDDSSDGGATGDASGTISWWGWTPDSSVGEKYIAEFNKVYPDIKVEYTNYENNDYAPAMQAAFQTGKGPDVYDVAVGGATGKENLGPYALDLAPVAEEALGADWKDKFATGYVDAMTLDGSVVGLPLGGVAAGFLWINQDLFDANGVSSDIKTYDDLKAACDTFAAAGVQCYTTGALDGFFTAETLRTITDSVDPTYYIKALQGEKSWDDPVFIKALDIMRQMQKDGIIAQNATSIKQYPEANNAFLSGKAAIVQMGSWYAQYAASAAMTASQEGAGVTDPTPFTMMPIAFPDIAGDGNVPGLFGETDYGLAVNAKSKNQAAAEKFVLWLTATTEGQQNVANAIDLVPALKGVEAQWDTLGLVNPDVQIPVFTKLYADAADPVSTRNTYASTETSNALVVASQSLLSDPSASTKDIAKQVQTDAVPIPAS